ncbi:hypothetical protein LCGC14_2342810 [marine sediment metagenome]|uniref:Uncharacterized protein n=1 Tax=marine sediment metagenome TaxID=412755 RepID=A0A0F9CBE1_9ZZZZ
MSDYCCELWDTCLKSKHGECCIHGDIVPPCEECDGEYQDE